MSWVTFNFWLLVITVHQYAYNKYICEIHKQPLLMIMSCHRLVIISVWNKWNDYCYSLKLIYSGHFKTVHSHCLFCVQIKISWSFFSWMLNSKWLSLTARFWSLGWWIQWNKRIRATEETNWIPPEKNSVTCCKCFIIWLFSSLICAPQFSGKNSNLIWELFNLWSADNQHFLLHLWHACSWYL